MKTSSIHFLTCVCSVVSLQLATLGEGLHAGGAVENSGFLGAGWRAWLMHSFMFLLTDPGKTWFYHYSLVHKLPLQDCGWQRCMSVCPWTVHFNHKSVGSVQQPLLKRLWFDSVVFWFSLLCLLSLLCLRLWIMWSVAEGTTDVMCWRKFLSSILCLIRLKLMLHNLNYSYVLFDNWLVHSIRLKYFSFEVNYIKKWMNEKCCQ